MPTRPTGSSAPGVRLARREEITAKLLSTGRQHLIEHGAAALSLRAVTRDLGMVSSAVYRYVANRDELLTLLVVDAYAELGDTIDAAVGRDAGDWADRFRAGARALRGWALREPARYALLYGSPVPGYHAPDERTGEPGNRVVLLLLAPILDGARAGELAGRGHPLNPALREDLSAVAAGAGLAMTPDALAVAVGVWSALIGAVSMEVFGQLGERTFGEPELLFDHQLEEILARLRE